MGWICALTVGAENTWLAQQVMSPAAPSELISSDPMPATIWTDGTTTVVAEDALQRGKTEPNNLITDATALLGGGPITRGERVLDPVDLIAALLREAYTRAVAAMGSAPDQVLVTHPDDWTVDQLLPLRQAATRAGLSVDLVGEAVSAASAYASGGGSGTRLLVVDAHRRTATVLARMGRVFGVLASRSAQTATPANSAELAELAELADATLSAPGARRELLNGVVLLANNPDACDLEQLAERTGQQPTVMPRNVVATGALDYQRALIPVAPTPIPPPPPPPPPPPATVPKVNHYAPVKKERKVPLVPLLVGILVVLILFELLFVYWPF